MIFGIVVVPVLVVIYPVSKASMGAAEPAVEEGRRVVKCVEVARGMTSAGRGAR